MAIRTIFPFSIGLVLIVPMLAGQGAAISGCAHAQVRGNSRPQDDLAGRRRGSQQDDQPALSELPAGFRVLPGKFVEIVTDLPADEPLGELTQVFELAMPVWCRTFGTPLVEVDDWRVRAYIMLDRKRFQDAGLIPAHLPDFPYGFQYGNQIWVTEQPSPYYRRHLLLHEGTHWFMNRHFGNSGPPWLMEGMAEWLATHLWDPLNSQLEMGIIPASKEEVPYWGRITRIQQELQEGTAPSLEAIMRYGNTAHQQAEAYAWSWAAVIFMMHHPDTEQAFRKMLEQPMKPDLTQTRWLFSRLRARWPRVRQQWSAFASDLEYGYDPRYGMLAISERPRKLDSTPSEFAIAANRSWQASGLVATDGQKLCVEVDGEIVLAKEPRPWRSYADGITLEYYRGQPIGKLMLCLAAPLLEERATEPLLVLPVGSSAKIPIEKGGELHFRVNESASALEDNSGQLHVKIWIEES